MSIDGPGPNAANVNIEYRAADSTASPHLALAAIVEAGVDGIYHRAGGPEERASATLLAARQRGTISTVMPNSIGKL